MLCAPPVPQPSLANMYAAPMVVLPALKPLLKQLNRVYPDPTGRPGVQTLQCSKPLYASAMQHWDT